jgi:hypothetical protein
MTAVAPRVLLGLVVNDEHYGNTLLSSNNMVMRRPPKFGEMQFGNR